MAVSLTVAGRERMATWSGGIVEWTQSGRAARGLPRRPGQDASGEDSPGRAMASVAAGRGHLAAPLSSSTSVHLRLLFRQQGRRPADGGLGRGTL
jgi:hypothetical protein